MTPDERIVEALNTETQGRSTIVELAIQLRDEGMAEDEPYALFKRHMKAHQDDADETKLDALLDTMDLISGYCVGGSELYPKSPQKPIE